MKFEISAGELGKDRGLCVELHMPKSHYDISAFCCTPYFKNLTDDELVHLAEILNDAINHMMEHANEIEKKTGRQEVRKYQKANVDSFI